MLVRIANREYPDQSASSNSNSVNQDQLASEKPPNQNPDCFNTFTVKPV